MRSAIALVLLLTGVNTALGDFATITPKDVGAEMNYAPITNTTTYLDGGGSEVGMGGKFQFITYAGYLQFDLSSIHGTITGLQFSGQYGNLGPGNFSSGGFGDYSNASIAVTLPGNIPLSDPQAVFNAAFQGQSAGSIFVDNGVAPNVLDNAANQFPQPPVGPAFDVALSSGAVNAADAARMIGDGKFSLGLYQSNFFSEDSTTNSVAFPSGLSLRVEYNAVPEPSSCVLLGLGLAGCCVGFRRRVGGGCGRSWRSPPGPRRRAWSARGRETAR